MIRTAGYEIDDDPVRVQFGVVWQFLSTSAYWGRWRTREHVQRQVANAWRVAGCYDAGGTQVGFARAVSDDVALAYLADVFVLPAHRGRGLGVALVTEVIDNGPGRCFRWLLHTDDAHGLYRGFGFAPADATVMERPVRMPN